MIRITDQQYAAIGRVAVESGTLDRETALSYATNRTNLQLRLETQGSDTGKGGETTIPVKGATAKSVSRPARPTPPSELDDLIER